MKAAAPPSTGDGQQDDGIPAFQLMDPELVKDQYGFFARLRERAPVWWAELPDGSRWLVPVRYEDIRAAHLDPVLRQKPDPEDDPVSDEEGGIWRIYNEHPVVSDPPKHTRLRKLLSSAFTARQTERLRPRITEATDELLDTIAAKGAGGEPVDLMEEFAWQLPLILICELLGVPVGRRQVFHDWAQNARDFTGGTTHEGREEIAYRIIDVIKELVEERRAEPTEDLLGRMVHARDAEEGRLSEMELLSTAFIVLLAGFETSVGLLGNGVYALLRDPEQRALVEKDPTLMPHAIEEFLRFDPSLFLTNVRICGAPAVVAGVRVRKGQPVLLSLGAANRDPERYPDPDTLDVSRKASGHLAFGYGIHRCIGAPLAAMEGEIAIGRLLDRFPRLRLAEEGELPYIPNPIARTLLKLPVLVD
ncbi:cytochrome P450 family protein [Streptomyces sp. SBT349]|uniref:cytochrome P450 family protein n=1 Tax=Streptomyces sp. SBT349 TaxID=1580539 RepID=UPI000B2329DE|nr:cytochrome P450 [Streptomyces sp. SBT349]